MRNPLNDERKGTENFEELLHQKRQGRHLLIHWAELGDYDQTYTSPLPLHFFNV